MKTVAIIGGGITGLTAAFELQQRGVPITLYEAAPRVGGVVRSVRERGYLAEDGPNSILETSPKIGELIRALGLEQRRVNPEPCASKRYIVRDRQLVALPGSAAGLFTTPALTLRGKLHVLREPFAAPPPADHEESVADFVTRRLGNEFLDYFVNPFVAVIYAGDPARLSVEQAFPKLFALEKRYGSLIIGQLLGARERKGRAEKSKQAAPQFSFDDGLQVLTDALGTRLGGSLLLNSRVSAVSETGTGWTVAARVDGCPRQTEHAAVIFAGPAYRLPQIQLSTQLPLNYTRLGEIHYPPVATLVLGFRREDVTHPLDGFGVLIPDVEQLNILGALFSSSLFPNRAPTGCVSLTVFIGGARAPHLATGDRETMLNLALKDLRPLLGIRGEPAFTHHAMFPQAIPQYELVFGRFRALMDDIECRAPGLFMAGNYRDGISLADSIISGSGVGSRVQQYLFIRSLDEKAAREHQKEVLCP